MTAQLKISMFAQLTLGRLALDYPTKRTGRSSDNHPLKSPDFFLGGNVLVSRTVSLLSFCRGFRFSNFEGMFFRRNLYESGGC